MADDKERSSERSGEPEVRANGPGAARETVSEGALLRPGDPGHAAYPLSEAEYWRQAHNSEPYFEQGRSFADYSTAYELGWVSYNRYGGEFSTAERVLANDWPVCKGVSTLSWEQARAPARAAWQRAENARVFVTDGSARPQEVKDTLGELVAGARDAELGFREAAVHARAPELVALLQGLADHSGAAGDALQAHVQRLGGPVDDSGTVAGAAQRVWLQIRGLFGAAGDETILAHCERGVDDMLHHYREALRRNLPQELHAEVQRQFEQAQRQHDHMKSLRDLARPASADTEQPA